MITILIIILYGQFIISISGATTALKEAIETVINVMTNPVQQYKIHKSIAQIEYTDISLLKQDK